VNIKDLLFDDILWAKRAREEQDAFAAALADRGVRVHYFAELLAGVLDIPDGRDWVLDRVITDDTVGPALVATLGRDRCAS
jgi:arginine deiminase